MASFRLGKYIVVILLVGGSKASDMNPVPVKVSSLPVQL
jgi:hypothetical protein